MTEAFLVSGTRTPIGRYGGGLATVRPDDLAATVLGAVVAALPALDPAELDEVILGCANQAGEDNRNVARMATLLAGLSDTLPGQTVNRRDGWGMDAMAAAAAPASRRSTAPRRRSAPTPATSSSRAGWRA